VQHSYLAGWFKYLLLSIAAAELYILIVGEFVLTDDQRDTNVDGFKLLPKLTGG
jgi:hypothetical protein